MSFHVEYIQKMTAPTITNIETERQIEDMENDKATGPGNVKN